MADRIKVTTDVLHEVAHDLSGMRDEVFESARMLARVDTSREAGGDLSKTCRELLERREHALQVRKDVGALTQEEEAQEKALHSLIRNSLAAMLGSEDPVSCLKKQAENTSAEAEQANENYVSAKRNAFSFAQAAFAGNSLQAVLCRDIILEEKA